MMTYCVGLRISEGLVLLSDTQTNGGLDHISRFTKMFPFERPGERVMALMTSGNLSITQGVLARLRYGIKAGASDPAIPTLLNAESMYQVAELVGAEMRKMQEANRQAIEQHGQSAEAAILLAGQRKGGKHRLFLIYSSGNFIKATDDTPFFQLGEHKYGKPILDRIVTQDTSIHEALKAACISMDSTLKSNLSVGMPLDLAVIEKDALIFRTRRRIEKDDPRFAAISQSWARSLRKGFEELPNFLEN
jgi:putative proteasome-type protease